MEPTHQLHLGPPSSDFPSIVLIVEVGTRTEPELDQNVLSAGQGSGGPVGGQVVRDEPKDAGSEREADPSALVLLPGPQHQEGCLDPGGGRDNL